MARAIKVKLNQLYKVETASEPNPAYYTPATVEIFSASSAVTIRATTNPEFDGTYDELPVSVNNGAAGEIYQTDLSRSVRFVSFSCSDASAEIYVSGFKMAEVEGE